MRGEIVSVSKLPLVVTKGASELECVHVSSVTQSWLTLCDPMDYSPPGSIAHRIFQAEILERVAFNPMVLSLGNKDRHLSFSTVESRHFSWPTASQLYPFMYPFMYMNEHEWTLSVSYVSILCICNWFLLSSLYFLLCSYFQHVN